MNPKSKALQNMGKPELKLTLKTKPILRLNTKQIETKSVPLNTIANKSQNYV